MTNKELSPRAQKALAMLEAGAQFREMLETNSYTGRTQFKTRLVNGGKVISGFGFSTFEELRAMLRQCSATTVSTYYALPYVKAPQQPNMDW